MTSDEAREVCSIMYWADGECSTCFARLLKIFIERFPQFELEAQETYYKFYQSEIPNYV